MKVKILSPLWGHEHLDMGVFLHKIADAGYDGIDTWIPTNLVEKRKLFDHLQAKEMYLVSHQHRAAGSTFKAFLSSFLKELQECAEPGPLLINSHTGKDYFSLSQHLELIDCALDFTAKTGIEVAHETHRGRFGYCPQMTAELFKLQKDFRITADLSHWVCVTESMLDNFSTIVEEAIGRSLHIHARVGFEEGPQVADPRAPEWKYALDHFLGWWDGIVVANVLAGRNILTFTTEFGPEPYMPRVPFSEGPIADQFEINCFMKDLLIDRYRLHR